MAIYWTKRMLTEEGFPTDKLETIKEETEFDFVTDGDGFEINMNGIDYQDYINNPDKYDIINGKLILK